MSNVTNAILAFGIPVFTEGQQVISAVNRLTGDPVGFKLVEDTGGTKRLEVDIAIAAFNYLHGSIDGADVPRLTTAEPIEELVARLRQLPWGKWGCSF